MKRWHLVLLWFIGEFVWNLVAHRADSMNGPFYLCVVAVSYMTSPLELLATLLAMIAIKKRFWERKSLAERQQEKADRAIQTD